MTTVTDELIVFQKLAGLPHPPTPFTLEYRKAMSGEGPHAYTWSDKPHRLIFDLCGHIEAVEARAFEAGAKAMQEAAYCAWKENYSEAGEAILALDPAQIAGGQP